MTSPTSAGSSMTSPTSAGFNNTPSTPTSEAYNLPFETWIAFETISSVLIAITLYINIVLVRYSCVKTLCAGKPLNRLPSNNSKIEQNNNSSSVGPGGGPKGGSTSSAEGGRRRRTDGTGKAARPLRVLCLLAAFFALLRVGSDQLELATYGGPRIDCKIYQVILRRVFLR